MLQTRLSAASAALRPYVWCFGQSKGCVSGRPLVVPLPARPKHLLTFFFRDRYRVHRCASDAHETSPGAIVVGPQTYHRIDLSVLGDIDTFTIHFQPGAFHHLFGVPMTALTNAAYEAEAVLGSALSRLEQELADACRFEGRVRIAEEYLLLRLANVGSLDPVGRAANRLFARNGVIRVAEMAAGTGLTCRQFERRFLAQVGVRPKLYARIIRFTAALDQKLASPERTWTEIAHGLRYHDQMHMIHDFRGLAGEAPARFLARLQSVPEFHTAFVSAPRPYAPR